MTVTKCVSEPATRSCTSVTVKATHSHIGGPAMTVTTYKTTLVAVHLPAFKQSHPFVSMDRNSPAVWIGTLH